MYLPENIRKLASQKYQEYCTKEGILSGHTDAKMRFYKLMMFHGDVVLSPQQKKSLEPTLSSLFHTFHCMNQEPSNEPR